MWCANITYIPLAKGFVYLVAVMDWFSRRVLAWRLSTGMEMGFCVEALQEAMDRYGAPEIFNTDQGVQFTSTGFIGELASRGVRISPVAALLRMDGKGRYLDNIFIERLWRSLKYEEVFLKAYASVREARAGNTAMLERFRSDGFLTINKSLSSGDVASLRRMLADLHRENVGFEEGALFDAMGVDDGAAPSRLPQIFHPRSFAPELIDSAFYEIARRLAEQILGSEVRFKADISLMKPALIGSATPWHQDEAFQGPAFEYTEISFWLALQPVDEANSCMAYIPGSHTGPILPHGFPSGDARIHALECVSGFDTPGRRYSALFPPAGV